MSAGDHAIGLDVGGTKTAAARVTPDGSIVDRATLPTPADDMAATLNTILEAARAVLAPDVRAVGIAAAGLVEFATGILRFAPNLVWRDVPLVEHLSGALGLPVVADNDNTAAAWGEFRFGAGRDYRHMMLVGVGTGIGGGIVADGVLFRGAHGFAADIGHIIVEPEGPLCGCGNRGCWEQVASGQAVTRAGRKAVSDGEQTLLRERAGGDPEQVTGPMVTKAAQDGDAVSIAIIAEVGRRLGEGIAGLVNVLDPEVVVVGGGVANAGELLLTPAREAFRRTVEAVDRRPDVPLVHAQLGNDAGVVGAATLALESIT